MRNFFTPFVKTAGLQALLWGAAGLAVSIVLARASGWHAHGLLHFGPATRNELWISAVEYLVIWLVPAMLFYGFGTALSNSRIRAIDVFGTTAFSLLPLTVMNLIQLMPAANRFYAAIEGQKVDLARLTEAAVQPMFILYALVMVAVLALMIVWLANAVKVSCNLSGGRFRITLIAGILIGDIAGRMLIGLMY